VCAHCSNLQGTKLAVEAGIDCVEHGIELDDEVMRRMIERGVWLSAALKCTEVEGVNRPEDDIPAFIAKRAGTAYQRQMASFQKAWVAGVRLSAATDGALHYFPLSMRSLARELTLMTELGLTPDQVIEIATQATAELLGLDDMGTLEVGKQANVLVVDGDPLRDLMSLDRPWLVMLGGCLIREPGQRLDHSMGCPARST
jgi:imidazolonepropionase-like amidohydrolase